MQEYKEYLIAKGYTESTAEGIISAAEKFLEWIAKQNIEITEVNYNDITAFIKSNQQRGIKIRTVQHIAINIKHYLNYLVEAGTITHNPALAFKLKNTKRKTVYKILNTEELEKIYKNYKTEILINKHAPPQANNILSRKRNKIILGLLLYQGIAADDVKNIELSHLDLREGKITIPATKRSNERTLKLEAHQIFELYDYINETRKEILKLTKKESNSLFLNIRQGKSVNNMLMNIAGELRRTKTGIENLNQIRASVITNWLKIYNKRKVQYMAGHRYVSSTEHYEASNIEALQEDVERFYPVLS